jgi:hypothetical protein
VEFYSLFIIPLGFLARMVFEKGKAIWRVSFLVIIALFVIYNTFNALAYPGCFRGKPWDFTSFKINLAGAGLIPGGYLLRKDYTDPVQLSQFKVFTSPVVMDLNLLSCKSPTLIKVKTRIKRSAEKPADHLGAYISCTLERNDTILMYRMASLDSLMRKHGEWEYVNARFVIPVWMPDNAIIKVYCWNRQKSSFFLDKMTVSFIVDR